MSMRQQRFTAARLKAQERAATALGALRDPARKLGWGPGAPQLAPLQDARRRRRSRLLLGLLLLFALLLLWSRHCSCAEPTPAPSIDDDAPPCPAVPLCESAKPRPKPAPRRLPHAGKAPPQARDLLTLPLTGTPTWLADFRLQVTARSLDLAVCFNGAEKPGALRWTTTVTPLPGTVADSEWEPALRGPALTSTQQQCVQRVLSNPPYHLVPDGDEDLTRLSLVLEF